MSESRIEVKMICEERARDALISELNLHPFGFRPLFPSRMVQSVYFDTHADRAVAENIAGISDRHKLRFRWYGPETRGIRGRLERKIRSNLVGRKEVLEIAEDLDVEGVTRRQFVRILRERSPAHWADELASGLEPVQWIRYQRAYYGVPGQAIRVTLDWSLECFDQRERRILGADRPTPVTKVAVVECKAPMDARDEVEAFLQDFSLRVDKCSKFILASSQDHGPVISSRGW